MMQALDARGTDVHRRSFPDSFHALQNLNFGGVVISIVVRVAGAFAVFFAMVMLSDNLAIQVSGGLLF
jgi:hypothetical protein